MLEEEQKAEKKFRLKLSPKMIKFKSLNRSKDFLKILKKKKLNTKYYTIYFDKNSENLNKYLNISFVMKKKIGNAVTRNKIKRKLKYAVQKIAGESKLIDLNYTYVIFGKNNVYKDKFENVLNEVNETFKKINTKYFTIFFGNNSNHFQNKLNKYLNISFVMKKKIGNAVVRNKIKRKLKYAVQKISKEKTVIDLNYTYIVFGKNNVYKDKFAYVLNEVNETFKKIKQMESRLWK